MYYICGYVVFKEKILCEYAAEAVDLPNEAEFTLNVSRGKLRLSPINFTIFLSISQHYCFFKARKQVLHENISASIFYDFYDFTDYNVESIARRLCNCFFKAFVKKETDSLKAGNKNAQKDGRQTKKRRISAKY